MKHEFLRRVSILLVVALVLAMLPMAVFAFGPGDKLYLQPNANWKIDNARFAAYFFGASGNTWADATLVEGEEDIYEVVIPEGDWTNVIFCRMNPNDSANNWNNKWSQSIDLPLGSDGNNLFTVNEAVWNSADGTWSYYEATVVEPSEEPSEPDVETVDPDTPTDPETEPTYPELETTWPEPEPINCPGYYLVGTMDSIDYWFVDGNACDRMFVENEDCPGEYILDYTFVEGDEIKVVYFNGYEIATWYNDGGDNYVISSDKAGEATVYFRPDGNADWSYYYFTVIPSAESSFVVAGVPGLCGDGTTGYGWDPTDLNNQLTDNGDGTYSKVYYDVAVGEYEFKVVECMPDGATKWIGKNNSDDNLLIQVTAVCDVTVTIDAVTKVITVTGSDVEEPGFEVEYIAAVGNGDGSWLNGANWDPADESNRLTEIAPGVFQITYTDVECFDNYQLKFAANGTWFNNWGGIYEGSGVVSVAEFNSNDNITIAVPYELADVTITLDLSNFDPSTNTGATFTVTVEEVKAEEPGAADIKWQVSADFTAESTSTDLRLITWVDSLDYASVTFTVTIGDVTRELSCSKVYTAINAGGVSLTAADIFGEEATYLATYTITGIPADVFNDIQVSVTWTDLNGVEKVSETRTFSIA